MLTLANGDRILMTPQMKAMFEPENLANASPATISRAGIIYISETELGWGPIVTSWLAERPPAVSAALKPCFDKFVQPVLDLIRWGPALLASMRVAACLPSGESLAAISSSHQVHADLAHLSASAGAFSTVLPACQALAWARSGGRKHAVALDKPLLPQSSVLRQLRTRRVSLRPVMHNEVVSQVQTLLTLLEGVLASKALLGGQHTPGEWQPDISAAFQCGCHHTLLAALLIAPV